MVNVIQPLWLVLNLFRELTAATGEWMSQFVRRPSKGRIAAVETVKRTLQRSWTFSGTILNLLFIKQNLLIEHFI